VGQHIVMRSGIRQRQYKLKQHYFVGIPADEVRATSPVSYMSDVQWRRLVDKWSSAKYKAISDQNKRNRRKVSCARAKGSGCQVAT
ncbi:unnamed protein product, partial [Urochloa humidicola]